MRIVAWNLEARPDGLPHLQPADIYICPEIGSHDHWLNAVSETIIGGLKGHYITKQSPNLAMAWGSHVPALRATGLRLISGQHRDGIVLECENITLMGVHLAARDRSMNARQCYEITDWAKRVGQRNVPVVVAGDCNTGPEDQGQGFNILTQHLRWTEQPDNTFCNPRYPRLDHFFGRGQVQIQTQVDPEVTCDLKVSDHRPLISQLTMMGNATFTLPEDPAMSRSRRRQKAAPQANMIQSYALPVFLAKLPERPKNHRRLYDVADDVLQTIIGSDYSQDDVETLIMLAHQQWSKGSQSIEKVSRREVLTAPTRSAGTMLSTISQQSQAIAALTDEVIRKHGPSLSNLAAGAAVFLRAYPTLAGMIQEAVQQATTVDGDIEVEELD